MGHIIQESELILNPDGSVYHLALLPGDLAETIFLVGDPDRVDKVSQRFDSVEIRKGKREFITHTGMLNHKPVSVVSTGIGTDNIDIVLNEIFLLFNADLNTRQLKEEKTPVRLIRIGTSGTVDPAILPGSCLFSESAVGADGLAWYYGFDKSYEASDFKKKSGWPDNLATPYQISAPGNLHELFRKDFLPATTLTCTGFYHPQGRGWGKAPGFMEAANLHRSGITNLEMETAGIYLLSQFYGFEAVSLNAILANRQNHTFSENPGKVVEDMISKALEIITAFDEQ